MVKLIHTIDREMLSRLTLERTYGGLGLRYAGSSGERGREVDTSIIVVASLKVRDIVTASRGLFRINQGCEHIKGVMNGGARTLPATPR
jgi:hypothetical protein